MDGVDLLPMMRDVLVGLHKTAWFQVCEGNRNLETRKEVHGCGRILMCDFAHFILGPLEAFWSILQVSGAPDTEEKRKSASCSLLAGRVLT